MSDVALLTVLKDCLVRACRSALDLAACFGFTCLAYQPSGQCSLVALTLPSRSRLLDSPYLPTLPTTFLAYPFQLRRSSLLCAVYARGARVGVMAPLETLQNAKDNR